MSCSKYHYVKFLDEVEEITDSKSNDEEEKINLIFSEEDTNMSSIDSEHTNYLTYVSKIVSQLKDTKEENEKLSQDYSKYFMECCSSDIEIKKLKEENEKLKLKTFEADTRCDGIKIKMNKNWLSEDIDPILNDRDHMKNYFDELDDLPDNLDYMIEFKEDMEEFFYENLVQQIQNRLNSLKIFGGLHYGHKIDEMICETIHDFVNEALTDGDCFEIEVEEESEEEESDEEESDEEESDEEEPGKLVDLAGAREWMSKKDSNQICIMNFSDNEEYYWLDGGTDAIDELDLDNYEEEDFKEFRFYIVQEV